MNDLITTVRTQSPDLVHFSPDNQDSKSEDTHWDMLSRRSILTEALDQHGVDNFLLMHDPQFAKDEFLFVV